MREGELTITGYKISRPADYWAAMRENYPSRKDRDAAAAAGFDHFGTRGLLGDYVCYRCGFLCDDEGE
jgi:hypothetical protein